MTALHILSDSNIGGAGKWLLTLCKNKRDYDAAVALPDGAAMAEPLKKAGAAVYQLNASKDKSFSFKDLSVYKKTIKKIKPDIVHTHGSLSGRIAAKLTGVKTVYTKHTMNEPRRGLKRFLALTLEKWLDSEVIAVSEATRANLIENGIKAQKITVIMSGTDKIERYDAETRKKYRNEYGIEENAFAAGIIGRLAKVKAHHVFLGACRHVDNAVFLIAGEGEEEAGIKACARELGIYDKCVFVGHVEPADIIYNMIDVCVSSSVSETFGLTLCEAMSLGIPVISTKSGGPQEILDDKSGVLVGTGDSAAISRALNELKNNKNKYKEMSEAAYARWQGHFSAERFARDVNKFYESISLKK